MTNGAPATGHVTPDWLWTRVNIHLNADAERGMLGKMDLFWLKLLDKMTIFDNENNENSALKSRYFWVI